MREIKVTLRRSESQLRDAIYGPAGAVFVGKFPKRRIKNTGVLIRILRGDFGIALIY